MKPTAFHEPPNPVAEGTNALPEARYAAALAQLLQARRHQPDNVAAQKEIAVCLHQLERYPEAADAYREALKSCPHDPELWANLGLVETSLQHFVIACDCMEKAVQMAPHEADIHYNLGNAYLAADRPAEARVAYQRAIHIAPHHYDALINLGLLHKQENDPEGAAACYRKAQETTPARAEAYANLATLLDANGSHAEAEAVLRDGISISTLKDTLYYNLGNILKGRGAYSQALDAYARAIEICPEHAEAHWNKALTHLSMGHYRDGWREYEWRLRKRDWPEYYPFRHNTPRWQGEDIHDKVLLVHDEQGYGDTIQFCRYLSMAKAYCKALIFETRRPLKALFRDMGHIDLLLERPADPDGQMGWDLHVPLMSLPFLLETEVDTIPCTTPYLSPDPSKIDRFISVLDRRRVNIGLAWAGNPNHRNDHYRSVSFAQLQPLLNIPRVDWHSLQLGPAADDISMLTDTKPIRRWGDCIQSFADTAALIWMLDLVICVDTAVAHLAGALGKQVWLLLPERNVDWRWQLDSDSTPWYPSMTLFPKPSEQGGHRLAERLTPHLNAFVRQVSSN